MQIYQKYLVLSLLVTVTVLLSSCEHLLDEVFDTDPEYHYYIQNSTNSALTAVIQTKANPGTVISGDGRFYYKIEPGQKKHVWNSSGVTDSQAYDQEKGNTEIYEFRVLSLTKGNQEATAYLDDTQRWVYKKVKNYEATYTLTIAESDF